MTTMDGDTLEAADDDEIDRDIPDGGWGWVVVFGALMINVIYDGCSYSFGILFTNLLDYFGDTKSNTAWIGSLFFSVPLLCGPLVEKVVARIGHRKGTVLGGIIAALGFALSSFATSTLYLCLTYGLLAGIGMAFPYFSSGVIVAEYFDKRRGLATGIVECGAGAGTIVFAPFTEFLIGQYGWRGALLILGGVVLNVTVCGTLFKPIQAKSNKHRTESQENLNQNESRLQTVDVSFMTEPSNTNSDTITNRNEQLESLLDKNHAEDRTDNLGITTPVPSVNGDFVTLNRNSPTTLNLSEHSPKQTYKHLRNWTFVVFSISNFVMYFWYDIPYVFVVDKSVTMGIDISKATLLITCIGVLNMFGNILYGFLSDRKCVNRALLYGASIALCGVSVLFMGFLRHFIALGIAVGAFGLFSSPSEAMCALILVDIVGLKGLEEAFGIILLLQGVANLIGPPVAGLLCDVTGKFDATFYTAGCCVIAASCLYMILPVLERRTTLKQTTAILNVPNSTNGHTVCQDT